MMIADSAEIPPLQTMQEWSEQAERDIEQSIAKNHFMGYRRQEDGQVILQESSLHPDDPVAVAGCITCLGSTVDTCFMPGLLSMIPNVFMGLSVYLLQSSCNKRISDAQELARLRDAQKNQESITRDLTGMIEQESGQEEWERALALEDVQESDRSATMDEN